MIDQVLGWGEFILFCGERYNIFIYVNIDCEGLVHRQRRNYNGKKMKLGLVNSKNVE